GGTMAFVSIFAIVLLSDPKATRRERWLIAAAVVPIAYAMVRSGARSALVSLVCGFVVIAWHRRNFQNFVLIPACIILVLKLGDEVSGGALLQRYSVLLDFKQVYYRQAIPTLVGWDYMKDNLLGGGLGKSGYSVPSFMGYHLDVTSDGDLGRLMIEMGIPGLIIFGRIMWVTLRTLFQRLQRLRDTPVSEVALASAACVVMAFIEFPSGSPFLGIPMGAMVWFFLGTFMKLAEEHEHGAFLRPTTPAAAVVPEKRFLYHRPTRKPAARIRRTQAP
ncbi:MAG: hypothetical protein KGS61_11610, partial [Verrucomicrobia bacterium]|nr:hypothetical protein [Verrucomicrobiota bacterium]